MPDLCFYAPWIMKEPIPDPFRMMLEKAGKKRISYDEADCSMRNIRKQGKVSRLHGPTLHALLTLIQIRKEKDSGAAGIQRGRDAINYFCMEYPGNQGKYVMTYNSKNGRFSGILKTEEKNEKLPGIREGKNTGEQYLALLAYANLVPDNPLFNEEFQKNFYILEEQEKKEWEDKEAALRAAFICCDAMYCEVIANPQQAVPLEKSQFRAEELEDVLPEYKIAAGVYAPNDEIYGKFHVLLPVNEKTKRTLFELKQIYSDRWDVNERTKERIPSLPEDYLVSKEAEEILQMVDKTPARLFMLTGDAGTGKTTDARMMEESPFLSMPVLLRKLTETKSIPVFSERSSAPVIFVKMQFAPQCQWRSGCPFLPGGSCSALSRGGYADVWAVSCESSSDVRIVGHIVCFRSGRP